MRGGKKAHQSKNVKSIRVALGLEHQTQLVYLGLLHVGEVAGVARLDLWRRRRVVIVVVLWVECHVRIIGRHGEGSDRLRWSGGRC
jgi:hypothetical protein